MDENFLQDLRVMTQRAEQTLKERDDEMMISAGERYRVNRDKALIRFARAQASFLTLREVWLVATGIPWVKS